MTINQITSEDIEVAYDQYFNNIYRFFSYKLLDKCIAEDLTSETFLLFVKQVKQDSEIINIKQYLFGIAKHVFLKYLKSKYDENSTSLNKYEDFRSRN